MQQGVWPRSIAYRTLLVTRMLAIALVLIIVPRLGEAEETRLMGKVTFVRDGDTIEVGGIAIRLNGISAPEQRQPYGPRTAPTLRT
jgi:endonuclease YncB( thermonuclease family)